MRGVAIAIGSMALLLLVASVALAVVVLRGGAEPAPGAFTPLSLGGPSGEALAVGSPAPEVALLDLEGRPMRLSEYRGKVVLVNFWASWCGPCIAEVPTLKRFYEKYRAAGLEIVSVHMTMTEGVEQARRFVREHEVPWRVVSDANGEVARSYRVMGLPTNVLIDDEGAVRYTHLGLGGPALEIVIRELLP